jgi:MFS family permease
VSRRYIADFVSKRERTKASAAFVGSSAMGMALGPLLARLFQHFPTLHFGPLTFNYITMGACAPHATPRNKSCRSAAARWSI